MAGRFVGKGGRGISGDPRTLTGFQPGEIQTLADQTRAQRQHGTEGQQGPARAIEAATAQRAIGAHRRRVKAKQRKRAIEHGVRTGHIA